MRHLSLRAKLLGAFVAVLVPVLALLFFGFGSQRVQHERAILDSQLLTAEALAQRMEETFDAAIGLGSAVANDPVVRTMDPGRVDAHLAALLARYPGYVAIRSYDERGRLRGNAELGPDPLFVARDISKTPYFRSVMATNSPVLSEMIALGRERVVGIVAAVPVRGPDGHPVGVLSVVIGADQLAKRFEETRLLPGQAAFSTDRTGQLVFHTVLRHPSSKESQTYVAFGPVRDALAGVPTTLASYRSPLTGDIRLGAFVPTSRYHWVVGVTMSREVALRPVHDALRLELIAFGALLFATAILAVALAQYLVRPVRRLEEAARVFGGGDLSRRVRITTGDELERLGASFNAMASQIEQRAAEAQRHQAQAEQRANQLAAVIASMGDGVLIADTAGRIVVANPALLHIACVGEAGDIGLTLEDHLQRFAPHRSDGTAIGADDHPLHGALHGQTFAGFEMCLRTPACEERLVVASGAPVRDGSGAIVLGVVVMRDVTDERRRAREKEALAQIARALVRELGLERMAEVVVEQSLHVLGVDMAALWLVESSRRELTLLASRNLVPEIAAINRRVSFDAPLWIARAARTGQIQVVDDFEQTDQPQSRQMAKVTGVRSALAIPLRSRGKLVGVVSQGSRTVRRFSTVDLEFNATVADLFAVAIENAHLFNEVRKALSLRDEWMAAAAHELRTPLTVITGWTGWLRKQPWRAPQERSALASIERQAERIARLSANLVEVLRVQAGAPELELRPLDLAALVQEQAKCAQRRDERHRFGVQTAGPLLIAADAKLVSQALAHLLETAERYSYPGTEIVVTVGREGSEAVVSVVYQGPVIPVERQPYLFEPFYEPVPSGAPGYVGVVSLGLFLSRRAVEAHRGHIGVAIADAGATAFHFSLPIGDGDSGDSEGERNNS